MTRVSGGLFALAACMLASSSAAAFELKHAPDGKTVRWGTSSVAFVVDPSVEAAVPGGGAAVASAVLAWSGLGDGPSLSSSVGPGGAEPKYDGQNSIVFMREGFAAAGNALAVTVSSIDDATGDLLDTDIVINGKHRFAVLPSGATDPGATPMPTDGAGEMDGQRSAFDLEHVVAHEVGHTMGLADVHDDPTVLMYALTSPGSAANRAPTSDDDAGLQSLYAGSAAAQTPKSGCGQASVAGERAGRAGDVWFGFLTLVVGGGALGATRRKRLALPAALAALLLLAAPDATPSSDSGGTSSPKAATARVASTTTREVSGMLQTDVELIPSYPVACQGPCPERLHAHVWGGSQAGVTQRLDGMPVPRVGDLLDVAYVPGEAAAVVLRVRSS